MSESELLARHRAVLPSWLSLYYEEPIELVSGEGCVVRDAGGNSYLDFFGGILTTISGHGVPEILDAIRSQASRLLHSSTLYLIRPMVELAEKVAALSGIPDPKVFFVGSGTEATEAALLCCTARRGSNEVLALRNSYHGRSFAAMAVTGNQSWRASSLSPLRVSYVRNGDRLRSGFAGASEKDFIAACVAELREVIATTTSGRAACMIAEPIQGVGGFIVPPDGFFGALKEVLDEHGILFVSDEVQTGWGRTGDHFWGYQAHGIVPDALTFAKGVGNGLALGGLVARAEVIDAVSANSISTFGGTPLATAGALANLDYLLEHDLQGNAARVGPVLVASLDPLARRLATVAEVRGRGLMLGVELVEPGTLLPSARAAALVLEGTRRRGVLIGKGGLHGNVLRIAPPLSVSAAEADEAARAIGAAIEEVDAEMSASASR